MNKKSALQCCRAREQPGYGVLLKLHHVGGSRALGAVDDVKADRGALVQCLVSIGLNRGMMHKDIRSFLLLDETKSL